MKLEGGNVNVTSGVGFSKGNPLPMTRLVVTVEDETLELWMMPAEARRIGLDLIGSAHASIADAMIRLISQELGLDGDGLTDRLREITGAALPDVP